ncbi:hypothetical protein [Kitasatospora sp. CB01950]|uniref:hypothetical protein n=1 Tax=Kitasatospora sp. CB01950 TaxID=1703930 RepID=UPI00093914BA|nr:hypothetical protein [Kitasatospora sp. CB01950]OKJ06700.1 hypothetical protein AMK19_22740 [Kitasatospora sp. CB01950]
MIAFRFTPRPAQGGPSGFDLGDMSVSGPAAAVSSADRAPDQGMMLVPSVGLLLDQVRALLDAGRGTLAFHGVDSSFRLDFSVAKGSVAVAVRKKAIATVPAPVLVDALLTAAEALARTELPRLPADDPARDDFVSSLAAFRALHD